MLDITPKIIHQIWLGEKRMPKHIVQFTNEMKDSHPDFQYNLWTDKNLPDMPPIIQEVYDSLNHPAMKSDLLRVYVLYIYGGIYIDADYKLLTNLNDLNCYDTKDAYIVYEKKQKVEDFYCSIYIANKNSKFLKYMISKINQKGMWLGPHWYAQCIYEYVGLEKYCNYKDILDKCEQYNLGYIDWHYIDANIAKHDFLASWYPNSVWKEKLDSNDYE